MADRPKCRRHEWQMVLDNDDLPAKVIGYQCRHCGTPKDEARSRRGKQARNYGTRAELQAARKYGGVKVGHIGGPVDIEGRDFATQMRTRRQLPPAEWRKAFAAMTGDKCPRLLIRFLPGPGLPPQDFFVFPAGAFLDWFGRDDG